MSDLNSRERRKLESLLQMGSGWVLNFNDRNYNDFFDEFVGVNIDDPKYQSHGPSKAKRTRSFWDQAPNGVVAQALKELMDTPAATTSLPRTRHSWLIARPSSRGFRGTSPWRTCGPSAATMRIGTSD